VRISALHQQETQTDYSDAYRVSDVVKLAHRVSAGIVVIALLVLCGWMFDVIWLKSVWPGLATMKANTALGFVLAGAALWFSVSQVSAAVPAWRKRTAQFLSLMLGLLSLVTLIEYGLDTNLGIDEALFVDYQHPAYASAPGRMAAMSAINFLLLSVAIFLIDVETGRGMRPSHGLVLFIVANSFLAILGYLFGIEPLYRVVAYSSMALHTAILFVASAICVACARPTNRLILSIISDDAAGLINRRLLPAAILIPPAIGWLRWQGELAGYYSTGFGLALNITSNVAIFSVLIWSSSRAVQKLHEQQVALTRTNIWQQAILNSADFTIISTDKLGTIRTINNGVAKKLGYQPQELINQSIVDRIHEPSELAARADALTIELGYEVSPNFDALAAKARVAGCDENDWTYIGKNGHKVVVRLSVSPLINSYGKISGFVAIGMDVTKQRNAEVALRESLAALDDRNRELQDFAFVASHDLQEPLRKIRMFSDRLLSEYAAQLDDRAQQYLKRNMQAATRMQTLIDDLMTYSRVATRGQSFVPVDLNKLVAAIVDDLEARIVSSSGKVEWTGLPTVKGDATQLRQLFQNLIANALKFRHPQRIPVVRVLANHASKGGSGWLIQVQDNGIGFDMAHAERIFAPFKRLHSRSEFEGTGIGLAIVRRIVERHGGHITARAVPGEGACFTIALPDLDGVAPQSSASLVSPIA
jgi:PAS domain S-box-containing protein